MTKAVMQGLSARSQQLQLSPKPLLLKSLKESRESTLPMYGQQLIHLESLSLSLSAATSLLSYRRRRRNRVSRANWPLALTPSPTR